MTHAVEISTPLGADLFRFWSMRCSEELGRPFEIEVDASSAADEPDADALLGQHLSLRWMLPRGGERVLDGCVTRLAFTGRQGGRTHYHIVLRPWLALLGQNARSRVFENASVPVILGQVFGAHPGALFENRLGRSYGVRERCVQYRETDFDFASRLMEEEGIYYFFEHAQGVHTLVLADGPEAHAPLLGYENLAFMADDAGEGQDAETIRDWGYAHEIALGPATAPAQAGTDARGLAAGRRFTLAGHPRADQNRDYLVTATRLRIDRRARDGQDATRLRFDCSFGALALETGFRPRRLTPRPRIHGPQTAIVVGPAGAEIATDELGRVQVRFDWNADDAHGAENLSGWIRVSQPWAGPQFGMIAIPRIGDEVVVDFLDGNPDRPLIVGRVYGAVRPPPWPLPEHMTRSGILTRSSPGGGAANANVLRFEDRAGAEQLYLHAERDLDLETEQDETHVVGRDHTLKVERNTVQQIGGDAIGAVGRNASTNTGNDHALTVGRNDSLVVGQTRNHSIGGNEAITVGAAQEVSIGADQVVTIGVNRQTAIGASDSTAVGGDARLNAGRHVVLEAGESITLRAGGASITLSRDGTIIVRGNDLALLGTGNMDIQADGEIAIRGSRVDVQG